LDSPAVWQSISEDCIGELGLRHEDLYTLTIGEYHIKMRAFNRQNERSWERLRYHVFEDIMGNPNIKKSSKPRRPSDLFGLSIDVKVEVKPTKVTKRQAETIQKMGLNVPEIFIDNG